MPEESALDQLLKSGEFLHHLDMDRKTADLVFDRRTIKALYEFMSSQHIDYVDFPISAGKESVVFKVIKDKKPLVLKIYKLSTHLFPGNSLRRDVPWTQTAQRQQCSMFI